MVGKELTNIKLKQKVDVITMLHVLEHIEKPVELFKAARRYLSPTGILIFQTPNTNSLQTGFKVVNIRNEFYDNILDLFWSVRISRLRYLIYLPYPLIRILSAEHLTFICKPSSFKN